MTDTIPCQVTYTYKGGLKTSYLITMELDPGASAAYVVSMKRTRPFPESGLERNLFGRIVAPYDLRASEPGTFTELAEYAAYLAYLRLEGVSRD